MNKKHKKTMIKNWAFFCLDCDCSLSHYEGEKSLSSWGDKYVEGEILKCTLCGEEFIVKRIGSNLFIERVKKCVPKKGDDEK